MKISISGSIVLYKRGDNIREAIQSFLNTTLSVRLLLLDNSLNDQIRNDISDLVKDERIEYISMRENVGFGAAHNIALKKIVYTSDYHLVLNPDVKFDSNVLGTIYQYMEANKDVGLLMPKILYPNEQIQYNCKLLPSPSDLILRRFLPVSMFKRKLSIYDLRFTRYNQVMEVPILSGCFMFMRTVLLLKTGYFDDRYFLYLEDTDLSRRFFKVAKNIYYPFVHIYHDHEKGSYKNLKLLYIHSLSAIKYFNKWGWWRDRERDKINQQILSSLQSKEVEHKTLKVRTA